MDSAIALSKFFSLLVIQMVAIFGNLLMIIVGWKCRKLRKFQNAFIFNMAFVDFLQGFVIMTSALINIYRGHWILGQTACKVFGILKMTLTLSSVYSLSGTSILRYFYVVKRTKRMNTMKKAVSCIACSWLICIFLAITPLFNWGILGFEDGKEVCTVFFHLTTSHTMVVFVTGLFLNVTIMTYSYICIFLKLRHNNQRIRVNSAISRTSNQSLHPSAPAREPIACDQLSSLDIRNKIPIEDNINNESKVEYDPVSFDFVVPNANCRGDIYNENCTVKANFVRNNQFRMDCYYQQSTGNADTFLSSSQNSTLGCDCRMKPHLLVHNSFGIYHQQQTQPPSRKNNTNTILDLTRSVNSLRRLRNPTRPSNLSSIRRSRTASSLSNNIPKTEMNLLKTICAIVVVFVCCWLPYVSFNMIRMFGWSADNNAADTTTMWLGFINSAVNPVIYGVMNKQFRNAMKKVLPF